MRPHTAELMYAGKCPHCRMVFDNDMACESRRIGEDNVISQDAVMADVGVCHEIIMIPDSCVTAATLCTPMNVHVFAEHIVIADREQGLLALELQILRLKTDRPEGVKMIVVANLCSPFYNNM